MENAFNNYSGLWKNHFIIVTDWEKTHSKIVSEWKKTHSIIVSKGE